MELIAGLSLSIFGYGNGYTKHQPPVVVVLPPPNNSIRTTRAQAQPAGTPGDYYGYWHQAQQLSLSAATSKKSLSCEDQMYATGRETYSYASATGAQAHGDINSTRMYSRRTRQVYESEEESDEEEESESDDESEESDDDDDEDEEDEDESDGEETVHQLRARRGREEHLRYHRRA